MKIIKKLYLSFALSLVTILLICLPKTNAKFLYENYGIAWDNHFTSFSQLKEVFYIEDPSGEDVNELWGGIKGGSTTLGTIKDDTAEGANDLKGDGVKNDFYTFGPFTQTKLIEEDDIRSVYSDYLIENLKGIELNVVNQTTSRMIVCFKIYYYAPKITTDDSESVHLTFGVYNTILHDTSVDNNTIKGEFIVDTGGSVFSDGEYNSIVEVPAERLSDDNGSQFATESYWLFVTRYTGYYYPHRVEINPYQILYDSNVKTIKTGSAHNSYKYPAQDNHATSDSQKYGDDIMSGVDLEDFILDPSESGSFNLSLYFGNYGDTSSQSDSASFVTSLALIAIPESEIIADIVANGGTAPATA